MMVPYNQPAKKRQYYLDIARAVAIISITLNHAVNRTFQNYGGQMAEFLRLSLSLNVLKTVVTVFSHVGVPLFLMISGVLLLNKPLESQADIKHFYKHNLLSLFLTTELWYAIMYWIIVLLDPTNTTLADKGILGAIKGMVKTMLFLDQTAFSSMWYMPMILCLYTTIPFVVMVKDKFQKFGPILFLPALIVFLYFMVLPALNSYRVFQGDSELVTKLREPNLFSMYYLYILAGYFVGKGALSKLTGWCVALLAVALFSLCCAYQFYAYSQLKFYLIDYNFPLLLLSAVFIFEWIRRKAHLFEKISRPVIYLSRISLSIYFLHIIIMSWLSWNMELTDMSYVPKLLFLETASVGGSIAIITPLSRIKPLRKYLFLIK